MRGVCEEKGVLEQSGGVTGECECKRNGRGEEDKRYA